MRQHVAPVVAQETHQATHTATLDRIDLTDPAYGGEAWIQNLVTTNPELLPVDEIEPAFSKPVTVCKEFPVETGSVDLFMVNAHGFPVLVETKLWANPEARRQVVAQALDYARCLAESDVAGIEEVVRKRVPSATSLYDLIVERGGDVPDRAAFYDAFAANIAKGRFLILLVGDGIRREVEGLTDFLRMHARMDFTFGLVELPAYRMPDGQGVLVTPRIVARTVDIERSATPVDGGGASAVAHSQTATRPRRTTVSEQQFLELVEQNEPGLGDKLRAFLDAVKNRGIEIRSGTSSQGSVQLYWTPQEGQTINFGVLRGDGYWQEGFHFFTGHDAMMDYKRQVADLIGGYIKETARDNSVEGPDGSKPRLRDLLDQKDAWLATIDEHIERAHTQLESRVGS